MDYFIMFVLGFVLASSVYSCSTVDDSMIKSGSKIKIGNAVYQCEKKQELDLK